MGRLLGAALIVAGLGLAAMFARADARRNLLDTNLRRETLFRKWEIEPDRVGQGYD